MQVKIAKCKKQSGVTSIEYALLASLIALAAIGGFSLLGASQDSGWAVWTSKVIGAVVRN